MQIGKDRNKYKQEKYEQSSKEKLIKNINKKFTTSNIGCVDSVEKFFGMVWGHGKPESEKTEQEKEWFKIWQDCRKEMMDKGNHERRSAQKELNQYNVSWNRYNIELPFKGEQ